MAGLTGEPDGDLSEKHVYLAGAIEYAPDNGRGWRREIGAFLRDELGLAVFDPCVNEVSLLSEEENAHFRHWKQNDRTRFLPVIRRIIDYDIGQLLEHTKFIVCLWDEYVSRGAGTAGEITLAYHHGIPVYLVCAVPPENLSSWAAGCATEVVGDFESLKKILRTQHAPESDGAVKPG
ncbi:hypothetical protein CVU37_03655 [candidate division BRC1 bacterium HGW-BRC1-1]|jgi:hypothetical protein|nr:MAG: hypothetical protein CVU37_03655 [candidate division BRC1 bacterium HGW-BRC1-1]